VKIIQRRYKKGREFLSEHDESLREFCTLVLRFLNEARAGVASGVSDERLATAEGIEDALDSMRKRFNKAAMHRMQEGGNVPTEMLYIEINSHLEAIGNHALNILQTRHQTHSFVA
jgi:phosphate:Na+ symporter